MNDRRRRPEFGALSESVVVFKMDTQTGDITEDIREVVEGRLDPRPRCEVKFACTNPGCAECGNVQRMCPEVATDRVSHPCGCGKSSCNLRVVMLLCTPHADEAMEVWPVGSNRIPQ